MDRWPADKAGTIYEGASVRTADELNATVILLAAENGWDHGGARPIAEKLLGQETNTGVLWCEDSDDSESLTEAAQEACDWLTEYVAPEGYSFAFDEGFELVSDEDY